MVQKAQDPKEKEENAIYIPVILNGLLIDGSNVLILVVLKVKVMGIESFTLIPRIRQVGPRETWVCQSKDSYRDGRNTPH